MDPSHSHVDDSDTSEGFVSAVASPEPDEEDEEDELLDAKPEPVPDPPAPLPGPNVRALAVSKVQQLIDAWPTKKARFAAETRAGTNSWRSPANEYVQLVEICEPPLAEASRQGILRTVLGLLEAGCPVDESDCSRRFTERYPFAIAGRPQVVTTRSQHTGETALVAACFNGHSRVAEALLRHGANPEKGTFVIPGPKGVLDKQFTAVQAARTYGHEECAQLVERWILYRRIERYHRGLAIKNRHRVALDPPPSEQELDRYYSEQSWAPFNIAKMYASGVGTERNTAKAAQWFLVSLDPRQEPRGSSTLPKELEPLTELADAGEPLALSFFARGLDQPYIKAKEEADKRSREYDEKRRPERERIDAEQAIIDAGFAKIRAREVERCKWARQKTGIIPNTAACLDTKCGMSKVDADYCTYSHGGTDLPPHCLHGKRCPNEMLCVFNHLPGKKYVGHWHSGPRKTSRFGTYTGPKEGEKEEEELVKWTVPAEEDDDESMPPAPEPASAAEDAKIDAFLAGNTQIPRHEIPYEAIYGPVSEDSEDDEEMESESDEVDRWRREQQEWEDLREYGRWG